MVLKELLNILKKIIFEGKIIVDVLGLFQKEI